jgi:hypothetical protein
LVLGVACSFHDFDNDDLEEVFWHKHVGGASVCDCIGVAVFESEGVGRFVSETNALEES